MKTLDMLFQISTNNKESLTGKNRWIPERPKTSRGFDNRIQVAHQVPGSVFDPAAGPADRSDTSVAMATRGLD